MKNQRIIDLRERENLSQRQLAKKLNISYTTIQNIENNINFNCRIDVLKTYSKYFKCSVDYLIYND